MKPVGWNNVLYAGCIVSNFFIIYPNGLLQVSLIDNLNPLSHN